MTPPRLKYFLQVEIREDGTKGFRLSLPHGAHLAGGRRRGKSRSYWLFLDGNDQPWPAYRDVDPLVAAEFLSVVVPMMEDLDRQSTAAWERWMAGRPCVCITKHNFCPNCGVDLRTTECEHSYYATIPDHNRRHCQAGS